MTSAAGNSQGDVVLLEYSQNVPALYFVVVAGLGVVGAANFVADVAPFVHDGHISES